MHGSDHSDSVQEYARPRAIRLGVILPSVNTLAESWLHKVCPPVASIQTTRMLMPDLLTPERLIAMDHDEAPIALRQILSCRPSAVGYACVASSVIQGPEYDRELAQQMTRQSDRPCITAMGAIVNALRVVNGKRLTLISPYSSVVAAAERRYLEAAGFEIVHEHHMGIDSAFDLAGPLEAEIIDITVAADSSDSDAILLSCMNFAGHWVVDELEKIRGKPVIAAAQALLWNLLRVSGVDDEVIGGGRLFTYPLSGNCSN